MGPCPTCQPQWNALSPSCLIEQKARSGDTGSLHSLIALSFVQFKSQTLTPAALPPPAPAHYAGRPIVLARELRDQLKWLASGYFVKASSNLLNFPPLPLLLYLSFNLFHICQRETQLSPGTPPLGMWDGGPDLVVSQGISMVLGLHGPAHCRCISMNLHKSRAEGGGGACETTSPERNGRNGKGRNSRPGFGKVEPASF